MHMFACAYKRTTRQLRIEVGHSLTPHDCRYRWIGINLLSCEWWGAFCYDFGVALYLAAEIFTYISTCPNTQLSANLYVSITPQLPRKCRAQCARCGDDTTINPPNIGGCHGGGGGGGDYSFVLGLFDIDRDIRRWATVISPLCLLVRHTLLRLRGSRLAWLPKREEPPCEARHTMQFRRPAAHAPGHLKANFRLYWSLIGVYTVVD